MPWWCYRLASNAASWNSEDAHATHSARQHASRLRAHMEKGLQLQDLRNRQEWQVRDAQHATWDVAHELLHLSGGNVGKLEALGVKRCVCFFAEPFSQELAASRSCQPRPSSRSGSKPPTLRTGLTSRLCFAQCFLPCARSRRSCASSASMRRAASAQKRCPPCSGLSVSPVRQGQGLHGTFHQQGSTGSEGSRSPLHRKGHR